MGTCLRRGGLGLRLLALCAGALLVAGACGPKADAERALASRGDQVAGSELVAAETGEPASVVAGDALAGETSAGSPASAGTSPAGGTSTAAAGRPTGQTPKAGEAPAASSGGDATGVTDTAIRIGAHLPLSISGLDVRSIVPVDKLVSAYWQARNRRGGVHGRTVETVLADDGYNPSTAIEGCKELVAAKVFFIFGYAGADQMTACGRYALERGIPYLSIGTTEKGLIGTPGYFSFSLTKEQEAKLAARYIAKKLDGTNAPVALLRMNSGNTDGIRSSFLAEAKKLGIKIAVDDAVDKNPNPSEMQAECIKMRQAGVKVVYVYTSGLVQYQGVIACQSQGYRPQWVATSNGGNCSLDPPFGGPENDGCIQFSTSHHTDAIDHPFETQACAEWAESYPDEPCPAPNDLAGPVGVWALLDMFRATLEHVGRDLTRETLVARMADFRYDNGMTNPLDFARTQVGGRGEVVWKTDAANDRIVEIDSEWRSDW